MNPTQKQFSLNRGATRKQIPISKPSERLLHLLFVFIFVVIPNGFAEYVYTYTGNNFNVWAPNRYDVTVPIPTPGGPNTPARAFSPSDQLTIWFTSPELLTGAASVDSRTWGISDGLSTITVGQPAAGISISILSISPLGLPSAWSIWAVATPNEFGGSSYRGSFWERGANGDDLSLYNRHPEWGGDWNAGAYVSTPGTWTVSAVPEPTTCAFFIVAFGILGVLRVLNGKGSSDQLRRRKSVDPTLSA